MTEPVTLRTDGPHSPDYTRQLGDTFAEAARCLNYATLGDAPGLEYPGDAYSLIGALCTGTSRLSQLLGQLSDFLRAQERTGRIADDHGRDPALVTGTGCGALLTARDHADSVTRSLQDAQNAISGLYVKEAPDAS